MLAAVATWTRASRHIFVGPTPTTQLAALSWSTASLRSWCVRLTTPTVLSSLRCVNACLSTCWSRMSRALATITLGCTHLASRGQDATYNQSEQHRATGHDAIRAR